MSIVRLLGLAMLFCCGFSLTLAAATREEEAKKYAGDLKHKDAKVRLQAVTELGKLGAASLKLVTPYVSNITDAIKDKDARVRGEASRTLGMIDAPDKKAAIEAITTALKNEKEAAARGGMYAGLGDIGALTKEASEKKSCRDALLEARKKVDDKREQKLIQAALQQMNGGPKKKE